MIYRPAFFTENPDDPREVAKSLSAQPTFENYLVSNDNRVAAETARQVSQNLGQAYNPLLIAGEIGLGKTHLLNATGHAALKLNPGARVYYTTLEGFTRDLVHGIREQRMEDFRRFYRSLDLWLVDDLEFLAGKDHTQEEFLHTFDDLVHQQRQIVIASHSLPQEISGLDDRLRSRLVGGVIIHLQRPDTEARMNFLQSKMKNKPLKFSPEVVNLLATSIPGNYSELEGAFNSLLVYAQGIKSELTGEEARKALEDLKFTSGQPSLSE